MGLWPRGGISVFVPGGYSFQYTHFMYTFLHTYARIRLHLRLLYAIGMEDEAGGGRGSGVSCGGVLLAYLLVYNTLIYYTCLFAFLPYSIYCTNDKMQLLATLSRASPHRALLSCAGDPESFLRNALDLPSWSIVRNKLSFSLSLSLTLSHTLCSGMPQL